MFIIVIGKLFLIIAPLIIIFFFITNLSDYNPEGFELNISESLMPNVSVVVLNDNNEVMNVIYENEFFYIQQRGLAENTPYSFMVVNAYGEVLKPVFETYTARNPELNWVESNNYYLSIPPGNQTIELLIINDSNGVVVAKSNILVLNLESIIREACFNLTNEPELDENGWSRESKILNCVSDKAVELHKVNTCDSLSGVFNLTTIPMHDECITNYAINTNDVSVCELTSMPKNRGFCKVKATNDWTQCRNITCDASCIMEKLDVQKDLCIQWVAIGQNNKSLCNEIQSNAYDMKEICYNMTGSIQ